MTPQDLRSRITSEVRHNPMQAALLGIGSIVALVIWAPRVSGWLGGSTAEESAVSAPAGSLDSAGAASAAAVLDTHAMLDEFRDISNEAKALTRFVLPIAATTVPGNPFHDEAIEHAETAAALAAAERASPPAPSKAASEPLPEDTVDHDSETAAHLKLSGVFLFGEASSALIDGEIRRVGDAIGSLRVAAIEARAVVLRGPRGVYRIEMKDALAPSSQEPPASSPAFDWPATATKDGS